MTNKTQKTSGKPSWNTSFKKAGKLLDYLLVEDCRVCRRFIVEGSSPALTVCRECWAPLAEQEAQIDCCAVSGFDAIKVAHAVSYEDTMKALIHKLKYNHDRLIALDLGQLLFKAFVAINDTIPPCPQQVLVPIPLSRWRMLMRGFNQSELLADYIQQSADVRVMSKLLLRSKHTKPQHRLNRQERAANLSGAFKCASLNALAEEPKIILVDDIHTSGSTLAEAAHALNAHGIRQIAAITVARALLN
jgi:competence protein ComFC